MESGGALLVLEAGTDRVIVPRVLTAMVRRAVRQESVYQMSRPSSVSER